MKRNEELRSLSGLGKHHISWTGFDRKCNLTVLQKKMPKNHPNLFAEIPKKIFTVLSIYNHSLACMR